MVFEFISGVLGLNRLSIFQDVARRQVRSRSFRLFADVFDFCHFEWLEHFLRILAFGSAEGGSFGCLFGGDEHLAHGAIEVFGLEVDDVLVRVGPLGLHLGLFDLAGVEHATFYYPKFIHSI